MRALLSNHSAALYLVGQLFSIFGDMMLFLAMGLWVRTLTGSAAEAGLTFFFLGVSTLLAPLAGLLVDRVRRRPLLVWTNLALAAAITPLLLVHSADGVWLIWTVMVVYGAGGLVISAGQSALLSVMVADELLGHANSALTLVRNGLRLVTPLAGAGLFAFAGARAVVMVDLATFVIAAVFLCLLDVRETLPAVAAANWATQVGIGFDFVRRTAVLRQLIIACAAGWSVIGIGEVVVYPVVTALGRPVAFLGILVCIQGVVAIAAAPFAPWAMRRLGEGSVTAIGLLTCAVGVTGWSVPRLAAVAPAAAVFGAGMTWLAIGTNTLIQRRTPKDLVGRVDSFAELAVSAPNIGFIALGSLLVSFVQYRLLLVGMALVMAVGGTWLVTRREQRRGCGRSSTQTSSAGHGRPTTPASSAAP